MPVLRLIAYLLWTFSALVFADAALEWNTLMMWAAVSSALFGVLLFALERIIALLSSVKALLEQG
ncbi:hypothetical protein XMM379_002964 [Aliiroseovarius sp. xm-m-379]|uniref:hypothetical protein n=1 Tax=unclassified Aliiroseovarius TaxID=2623558 RepID=UPI0015689514|nr:MULTISPECIES: hypothetical protein [unclassified Aliiroseovarius]NRP12599.1 hypothetical protein [Aliiroseovarius sp. xm-d-517]NRP26252.1 hypothetical protein [Aliiroseovarius sp. xm-m-379]NRP31819.1 hypothetical protein [Aliiroseovarius sp. xm-m-314]NRP35051.1 hypothetical protein [Aliiroseovarius sp. xm-a-104]NRP42552.1 hypothetical protein [Aliiroseovarius sp. xm-m-339-2]